jgi:hypothetical protein
MGRALTWNRLISIRPPIATSYREYEGVSARLVASGTSPRWNIRADALQRVWRWEAALEANAKPSHRSDPQRFDRPTPTS